MRCAAVASLYFGLAQPLHPGLPHVWISLISINSRVALRVNNSYLSDGDDALFAMFQMRTNYPTHFIIRLHQCIYNFYKCYRYLLPLCVCISS